MRGTNGPDATGYQCQFFFVITERTEQIGSRAKTFEFYSVGPDLESRLEHRLSSLSFRYLHQQLHVDSELYSRK